MSVALALLLSLAAQEERSEPLTLVESVRRAITRHPLLWRRRADVERARAELDRARALFDPTLAAEAGHRRERAPHERVYADRTRAAIALRKETRFGMSIAPSLSLLRAEPGDAPIDGRASSLAVAELVVTQRLLEGRGEPRAAAEHAAEILYGANRLELEHEALQRAWLAALAYWSCVALARSELIAFESEERAKKLLADIGELVRAAERPAADLFQPRATLGERRRLRIEASRASFAARQALALAIGAEDGELALRFEPIDPFPAVIEEQSSPARLFAQAEGRRRDLAALRLRGEAAQTLVAAAGDALLPELDLEGTVAYAALGEGSPLSAALSSPFARSPGYAAELTLRLVWPIENRAAEAELREKRALLAENDALAAELLRTIRSDVSRAIEDLAAAAEALNEARQIVEHYRRAADGGREKLKSGLSTVLDVVATEDRLTQALLDEIEAQRQHASALATLRFASAAATLPDPDFLAPP